MKSIAFINQKGGVGKTTSTINIGAGLSRLGKKVLLVDFDPQANLTQAFAIIPDHLERTVYQLLKAWSNGECKKQDIDKYILVQTSNLFLLPSNLDLSAFENEFNNHHEKEFILKNVLKNLNQFDYILIDCPPSLGLLTINVLSCVHEVYIPVLTEFFALQGLGQISNIIEVISSAFNPDLKLTGIIGTQFNNRKLHKDVVSYLKNTFKDAVFKTVIRENIALAEAPSFGKDIYSYSPNSNGAKDYYALCKEILKSEKSEKTSRGSK